MSEIDIILSMTFEENTKLIHYADRFFSIRRRLDDLMYKVDRFYTYKDLSENHLKEVLELDYNHDRSITFEPFDIEVKYLKYIGRLAQKALIDNSSNSESFVINNINLSIFPDEIKEKYKYSYPFQIIKPKIKHIAKLVDIPHFLEGFYIIKTFPDTGYYYRYTNQL